MSTYLYNVFRQNLFATFSLLSRRSLEYTREMPTAYEVHCDRSDAAGALNMELHYLCNAYARSTTFARRRWVFPGFVRRLGCFRAIMGAHRPFDAPPQRWRRKTGYNVCAQTAVILRFSADWRLTHWPKSPYCAPTGRRSLAFGAFAVGRMQAVCGRCGRRRGA